MHLQNRVQGWTTSLVASNKLNIFKSWHTEIRVYKYKVVEHVIPSHPPKRNFLCHPVSSPTPHPIFPEFLSAEGQVHRPKAACWSLVLCVLGIWKSHRALPKVVSIINIIHRSGMIWCDMSLNHPKCPKWMLWDPQKMTIFFPPNDLNPCPRHCKYQLSREAALPMLLGTSTGCDILSWIRCHFVLIASESAIVIVGSRNFLAVMRWILMKKIPRGCLRAWRSWEKANLVHLRPLYAWKNLEPPSRIAEPESMDQPETTLCSREWSLHQLWS